MTYEVVLDNSRMLANCFDNPPLESFVLDLPAWHVNLDGSGDSDAVSSTDTGTEMVITPLSRIGAGYFAEIDNGAPVGGVNVYMPSVASGYALTRATYVVIAYRDADDGGAAGGYSAFGYVNEPIDVPFLYAESSGVSDGDPYSAYVFDGLPVGAYSGEQEWPDSEIPSRLSGGGVPANRLWNEDFVTGTGEGTTPIHVAYFALRLYYDPA